MINARKSTAIMNLYGNMILLKLDNFSKYIFLIFRVKTFLFGEGDFFVEQASK